MTEIKLSTEKHDIADLLRYLDGDHHMSVYDRAQLVKDIRQQLPKPAIEEPEAFGSLVRAIPSAWDSPPLLWQKTPMHGKHYWESETGAVEVWPELTDVEVLRVGLGDTADLNAAFDYGVRYGSRRMNTAIHSKLVEDVLPLAIANERRVGVEKAIQAVEELAS